MADEQINVVARFKAKSSHADSVRKALEKMVAPTRAEAGNLGYDLHQGADDPSEFVLYEKWRSKAALDEHLGKPHFKTMDRELSTTLEQPYSVTILKHIAGGHD